MISSTHPLGKYWKFFVKLVKFDKFINSEKVNHECDESRLLTVQYLYVRPPTAGQVVGEYLDFTLSSEQLLSVTPSALPHW